MKIHKIKLYNFVNIRNTANINILIYHKKLLSKKGILTNIGSYIIILIKILLIIFIIIHDMKYKYLIKNKINAIILAKNYYYLISSKKENISIDKIRNIRRKNAKINKKRTKKN